MNSVRDILKESDYWINLDPNSHEAQSQRNRIPKFPELEKALSLWAQEFANLLGISKFKASDGWLSNFKKRIGLHEFNHHGEASSAPLESLESGNGSKIP
ncbi:16826_t:CDS:2 [Dentiscutata heterogama]|uniref:16826_t:CDS:1 n=1 Tax=Dentiscutata heterogama TaxID=1316150 RepID=A0ACA9LU78_9GLOM|nr:16826_t:CDS:2 [Dentiscutata heterogama]